jgi:hypothetical protein
MPDGRPQVLLPSIPPVYALWVQQIELANTIRTVGQNALCPPMDGEYYHENFMVWTGLQAIKKAGVSIFGHTQKLMRDFVLHCDGLVDLSEEANLRMCHPGSGRILEKWSLASKSIQERTVSCTSVIGHHGNLSE